MDASLLEIICCPATHLRLRVASPQELEAARRASGSDFTAGLTREDGEVFYPIRQGIPLLIPEEAVKIA